MSEQGFDVELDLFGQRITTLSELGDLTGDLVRTAVRLAERLPMLGTAPPAVHLAMRLREAAGKSGLAGEVEAAEREVRAFNEMLNKAKRKYQDHEDDSGEDMRRNEDAAAEVGDPPRGAGSRASAGTPVSGEQAS